MKHTTALVITQMVDGYSWVITLDGNMQVARGHAATELAAAEAGTVALIALVKPCEPAKPCECWRWTLDDDNRCVNCGTAHG